MMQQITKQSVDGEPLVVEYLKSRSPKLKEKVLMAYLPLVKYIIGRMNLPLNGILNKEDLYQYGMLGLMTALERYNPSNEASFKTFAYKRINGSVLDAVRKNSVLTRDQIRQMNQILKATTELQKQLERDPSPAEICKEADISADNYYHILQISQMNFEISIDVVKRDAEGETSLMSEIIEDKQQLSPELIFEKKELKAELKRLIQDLPERPRLVLALYFYEELTLFDIGQVLDISESRVSQIMNQTLVNIRKSLSTWEMSLDAV